MVVKRRFIVVVGLDGLLVWVEKSVMISCWNSGVVTREGRGILLYTWIFVDTRNFGAVNT